MYIIEWDRPATAAAASAHHHNAATGNRALTAIIAVAARDHLGSDQVVIKCDSCELKVEVTPDQFADDIMAALRGEAHEAWCQDND